jgi:hypothetical protein
MQPGADVSQREQYGWMLPGGRETLPISDPAGESHDWRYARHRYRAVKPHLSSLLESLRRPFAQPTISAYCYRPLMS